MSRLQSDTERIGKTVKRITEGRFEGKFNESKSDDKDRAKKEVFIIENGVPLRFSPHGTWRTGGPQSTGLQRNVL